MSGTLACLPTPADPAGDAWKEPRMTARLRRWLVPALAPLAAAVLLAGAPAAPAGAAPSTGGTSSTADDGADNPTLNEVLDRTGRRYLAAKAAVATSAKTQLALAIEIRAAETRRDAMLPQVKVVAAQSYRTGSLSALGALLDSADSDSFLRRALSLDEINTVNDAKLAAYDRVIDEVAAARARLDQEIRGQRQNLAAMRKQREAAQKALNLVGGQSLTGGFVVANSPLAAPAPRNADGGFSPESCTIDDPTTTGCVTARTLHMYQEVKKAGFNRFVSCHRNGGPFEHPKGRACDWSLQRKGFSVAHNADMKGYGNNLMAFLVRNADRLGVLYVIWYRQVWFPATGWGPYHGDSSHMDHVHVSMI
jgi:peptidoglycan DL-endopeptidase CwlO